ILSPLPPPPPPPLFPYTTLFRSAATLGAGRLTTFTHVTLPLVAPGIAAGAVLFWARALGEFGATIMFAGNYPGITQTMPLAVYRTLEGGDLEGAIVLGLVSLTVSFGILATRVRLASYERSQHRQRAGHHTKRVALTRALAVHQKLLLLDAPLAALDAGTRVDTRAELQRHLTEHDGATLLVTHDPLDALVLA